MGYHTEGDIVPFKSKAQQRFAFATRQPWAKKWASETKSFKRLPQHVKKRKGKKRKRR